MNKISVLGVNFDNVNMAEAVDRCKTFLASDNGNLVVTPNPEIVMRAKDNQEFKDIINNDNINYTFEILINPSSHYDSINKKMTLIHYE